MLTFVILAVFAAVVGVLTERQIMSSVSEQVTQAANDLGSAINPVYLRRLHMLNCGRHLDLTDFASADHAQIRVYNAFGKLMCTQVKSGIPGYSTNVVPRGYPRFGDPYRRKTFTHNGYRLASAPISWKPKGSGYVIYARPLASTEDTISKLKAFLGVGVVGGAILALLAGLLIAQRAMRPVAALTEAGREIARTRDPSLRLPHFAGDDEVAELAQTLEDMLAALDAAHTESELALARQREFVADASHELRTPLTSVLANLELLADELDGEQADSAKSALRATRRMRRLVGDLLLLARADAERRRPHAPIDLGASLTDAAAEIGALADHHELTISPGRALVSGHGDDLHRMALNLVENAIRYTPPGTRIHARTSVEAGHPTLVVEDDGPGIPPELQARVFERFVRGSGDTGDGPRGTGLGLAIVSAVADAHGANVTLTSVPTLAGTRFEIVFPPLDDAAARLAAAGGRPAGHGLHQGDDGLAGERAPAGGGMPTSERVPAGGGMPTSERVPAGGSASAAERAPVGPGATDASAAPQISTTTGSTIGRRRKRS